MVRKGYDVSQAVAGSHAAAAASRAREVGDRTPRVQSPTTERAATPVPEPRAQDMDEDGSLPPVRAVPAIGRQGVPGRLPRRQQKRAARRAAPPPPPPAVAATPAPPQFGSPGAPYYV